MPNYEQYTKEELIRRIRELESRSENSGCLASSEAFKKTHSVEILDILPDMLSVFDHNYNYIALASSEDTVHVGGSGDNLCGKNLTEILPPDAYKPVKENFDRVLSTGKASIGYHNLVVDDKIENFENRVIPLNDEHILCICRNITDTVKAQKQLQMVTSAVNNSIEEIYAAKTDGTIVFANKQFVKHYQLTGDISRYKVFDLLRNTQESWQSYVEEIKKNGNLTNPMLFHSGSNGQSFTQEVSAFILKDNADQELIWTIGRDITERIEQEKKIQELNQLMATILNNLPVYLFVKDTGNDFRYLYWNKECENRSHIPASFAISKNDAEIFPDARDSDKFKRDDLQLLQDGQTREFEEDYTTAKGEKRYLRTIKTLVPLEGKKPLLIGISWDITEQKKTEQELIKARIKAEEADKLKSAFLANMSHEIRTPLNAIVGFSKLLGETEDHTERAQYADIIDKNTELLLQLINDILDLSKIEAGMLDFNLKPVNINTLCRNIYESHHPRTKAGVELIYDPPGQEIITLTDSNRLAQVLNNLLNNAQKFTRRGTIRFGYRLQENMIGFYVKDTGIGIAPENLDKIFNRFIKLNTFVRGTGLGLSICRMIIENLGGKISATSVLNEGTEFRFSIPVKQATAEESPASASAPAPGRTDKTQASILIAEDVESNFLLLKTLLDKHYKLFHARNGYEAIDLFHKESPDLILMDIKMPELDGLETTRRIREKSTTIPIIALTAFAFESDKENALKAGCNDFLVKPVSSQALRQIIAKYI